MIKNGIGGANTNKNGKNFENKIFYNFLENSYDLYPLSVTKNKELEFCNKKSKSKNLFSLINKNGDELGLYMIQHGLYKWLKTFENINSNILSKKLVPDNTYVSYQKKTIFIIEIKFQQSSGSVDEKLTTCDFKLKHYKKLLEKTGFKVEYIYILNDWFKQPQYRDYLKYILETNCHYSFNEIPIKKLGLN